MTQLEYRADCPEYQADSLKNQKVNTTIDNVVADIATDLVQAGRRANMVDLEIDIVADCILREATGVVYHGLPMEGCSALAQNLIRLERYSDAEHHGKSLPYILGRLDRAYTKAMLDRRIGYMTNKCTGRVLFGGRN
jgi:hypothetical protein